MFQAHRMNGMKVFLLCLCVIVIIFRFSSESEAKNSVKSTPVMPTTASPVIQTYNPYDMSPSVVEKLSTPAVLPGCPWIKIIEWRQPVKTNNGGPSNKALEVLGSACVKAVTNFVYYAKHNKYNIVFDFDKFHQSFCLMPAYENSEGLKFRNLNDYVFRFRDREKAYDDQGQVNIFWGYTSFKTNTSYMRNDVINEDGSINKKTVTIFVHELYHAMSWQSHLNDMYHNNAIVEEDMAFNFTQYLGFGM